MYFQYIGWIYGLLFWYIFLGFFVCIFIQWVKRVVWYLYYDPHDDIIAFMVAERESEEWNATWLWYAGNRCAWLGVSWWSHISI